MPELSQNRLKVLATLTRRKGRREHGLFLVEGVRLVRAAVDAGAELTEILIEHELADDTEVLAGLASARAPIHPIGRKDLVRLSDVKHGQGVIAVARSVVRDATDGLNNARTILALDGVQDPGNVGTLVRTAAWYGVDAVLAGPGTAEFESPKVVRSTMGGMWDVALVQTDDLAESLRKLADRGLPITGGDLDGQTASDWKPESEGVLVLGSEAHGISDEIRAMLDQRVTLLSGRPKEARGVESLNVVVAGGILMERWLGSGE